MWIYLDVYLVLSIFKWFFFEIEWRKLLKYWIVREMISLVYWDWDKFDLEWVMFMIYLL